MIALTRVLFEQQPETGPYVPLAAQAIVKGKHGPQERDNFTKEELWRASATPTAAPTATAPAIPIGAVAAAPVQTARAAEPAAAPTVTTSAVTANRGTGDKSLMTRTFNAVDPHYRTSIAGAGQKGPIDPEHQRVINTKYRELAGVPHVPAVTASGAPVNVVHGAEAVKSEIANNANKTAAADMSGTEHAMAALKKGAHAVGDVASTAGSAIASGAKQAAEHLSDHPLAAAGTLAAGALGGFGLRRIMQGKKQA